MRKSTPELENEFSLADITTYQSGVVQASAYRTVRKFTADALKPYKLTCMQWFLIGLVCDTGALGIRITDLSKKLDTTLAYTTGAVNALESRGIIQKKTDKNDGRTKLVVINPSYTGKCLEIEAYLRGSLRKLFYDKVSAEEMATYVTTLFKIARLG